MHLAEDKSAVVLRIPGDPQDAGNPVRSASNGADGSIAARDVTPQPVRRLFVTD